jgi:hypothetical protein
VLAYASLTQQLWRRSIVHGIYADLLVTKASPAASQKAGLNAVVYQEIFSSPTTHRDFIQYRSPVQFNSPNKVTKTPHKFALRNLTDTPSKKPTHTCKGNDPNSINTSPSRIATSVSKRKQRVEDLRRVAKARKVSGIRTLSELQQEDSTTYSRVLPDSDLSYVHKLCGRSFTTAQVVYDHHAGLANGTSGCWVRHGKPQGVEWYEHYSTECLNLFLTDLGFQG